MSSAPTPPAGLSSRRYDLHQGRSWQQPVRGLLRDHSDCGKDVLETVAPDAQGDLDDFVHHVVVAQGHLTAAGRQSDYGRQIAFSLVDAGSLQYAQQSSVLLQRFVGRL
jgi:hypothetical protein